MDTSRLSFSRGYGRKLSHRIIRYHIAFKRGIFCELTLQWCSCNTDPHRRIVTKMPLFLNKIDKNAIIPTAVTPFQILSHRSCFFITHHGTKRLKRGHSRIDGFVIKSPHHPWHRNAIDVCHAETNHLTQYYETKISYSRRCEAV